MKGGTMQKLKLVTTVLIFAVLIGCSQKENHSIGEFSSNIEASVETPEKMEAELLSDLANQEFSIKGDQISKDDYSSMEDFGKSFVNLYTGAVANQERVSFNNYISNEKLLQFTNKMLELEQQKVLKGGFSVIFGLNNEFEEVELKRLDSNLYRLDLSFVNQGSGMSCKLLVQPVKKSLKIVDLYFGNKDGVDTLATGHPAERRLDKPGLWDDKAWVDGVMERLDKYEIELNK